MTIPLQTLRLAHSMLVKEMKGSLGEASVLDSRARWRARWYLGTV
jgi:hypothetical protein